MFNFSSDYSKQRRSFLLALLLGVSITIALVAAPAHADGKDSGKDKGDPKSKIVFTVGPVTKTPDKDNKQKSGDGKSKDGH